MNRTPLLPALTLLGALPAACGGTDMPSDDASLDGRASVAAAAQASWPVAALLSDDGSVMPSAPQAATADPGAHTRAGRYASPAQAEQLERTLAPGVVRVGVRGSGAEAVEEGAARVYRLLAAMPVPASAPVLIEGAHQLAAAALIDHLAANGVDNAWLATQ
jgi:hypothetical protein